MWISATTAFTGARSSFSTTAPGRFRTVQRALGRFAQVAFEYQHPYPPPGVRERYPFVPAPQVDRSDDEMLAIARARMQNAPDAELRAAADEQRKITELRLAKLVLATTETRR